MKLAGISLVILTALLSLILLSPFSMSPMAMDNHDGTCLAATAAQGMCPPETNSFAMMNMHSDFVADFSTAVFESNTLLLVLALLALLFWLFRVSMLLPHRFLAPSTIADPPQFSAVADVRAWFARLEHSPTAPL